MAVDIVHTFPNRACKAGKGHELYYCTGSAKGFITSRMREIYRRYPPEQRKYKQRTKKHDQTADSECLTEDLYTSMKVQLSHIVYTDRTESEIVDLTRKTLVIRRAWIKEDAPTAAEILKEFPRFTDTPTLVSQEFAWCYEQSRDNSSVFLETAFAPNVIQHCHKYQLLRGFDYSNDSGDVVMTALQCLLILLPTTGRHRVASSVAVRYIFEDSSVTSSSLDDAVSRQQDDSTRLRRTQPFILKFGHSYFVLVDGTPVLVKPSTMSVAVDVLLKSFFVFNVHYPQQTSVLHNFLAHTVLKVPSALSPKAMKLHTELFADADTA